MMSSKRDVICRDLHALEPTDIQAFIDRLNIMERHRVNRGLNVRKNGVLVNAPDSKAYNIEHLERAHGICNYPQKRLDYSIYVSTGTAGRKVTERCLLKT
jgi:hypothetical protein